jgi:hypothetical protein
VPAGLLRVGRIRLLMDRAGPRRTYRILAAELQLKNRVMQLTVTPDDDDSMPELACRYCGARIVDDGPRTPCSVWSAPEVEDPTACLVSAPGHTPFYDGRTGGRGPGSQGLAVLT